ncbi:RNA polymerase-binding protein [Corynebacterium pollutisoli]|uniref:RNA polymerase-binding protein RbpA n=1 Tax=Corynebacterium pollutisoli TaxID=1610489 RepID=A0A1X7JRD5_9CORY|nr:RNA polymerase-binding protein RbpA [Corynebacterium pollutisoli]NLP39420.1 RNA polymerase-binding protein RbpA [Corynebacterium pollutisoli]SMG30077.1 RNA polymerase-binding protein [Corynebacterium pollutisoli]HJD78250.1 RNA polymerase-binding protein RbpA [Corynebacterium pollutisoli]
MADRVLRGSRMGAVSYETDRDHDLAPRQMVKYRTENGEIYEVPFADDAEIPEEWMCKNGQLGTLVEGEGVESKPVKPPRTHWDMLLERRSLEELDVLLEERIELLRKRRRSAARLLKEQQAAEAEQNS